MSQPVPASKLKTKIREFLKSKYGYLVVDKLLLGAAIGIVILAYNLHMTNRQQAFEQAEADQQRQFEKAQYVSQLLPQVLDAKNNPQLRVNALGALVDTGSIDPSSAMRFAQALLVDKQVNSLLNPGPSVDLKTGQMKYDGMFGGINSYLRSELLKEMPNGLYDAYQNYTLGMIIYNHSLQVCDGGYAAPLEVPRIAQEYESAKHHVYECDMTKLMAPIQAFWAELIRESIGKAIADGSDSSLDFEDFPAGLVSIASTTYPSELKIWAQSKSSTINQAGRIGLAVADDPRDFRADPPNEPIVEDGKLEAFNRGLAIESLFYVPTDDVSKARSQMILSLVQADIPSPRVALVLVHNIISILVSSGRHADKDTASKFNSYYQYLMWATRYPRVASAIREPILTELRRYFSVVASRSTPKELPKVVIDANHMELLLILLQPDCVNKGDPAPEVVSAMTEFTSSYDLESDDKEMTSWSPPWDSKEAMDSACMPL